VNGFRAGAWLLGALLLTGCAAASAAGHPPGHVTGQPARTTGQVTGLLLMAGGPLGPGGQQPAGRPIPGTVIFGQAGHRAVLVQVTASGKFSLWLPPGRYRLVGRSPVIEAVTGPGKESQQTCSQPAPVTVKAGPDAVITVVCVVP
jgi:hypothetical protein